MANSFRRSALQYFRKHKNIAITSSIRQNSNNSESNILKSVFKDIAPTNYTVNDFVWLNLDRWPDKTAVVSFLNNYITLFLLIYNITISYTG